jgi:hypothetical protein
MKDFADKEIKIISNEIKDLVKLVDNLEIDLIDKNKKSDDKIRMYRMMMENLILEYHETCKKAYEKN